MDTIVPFTTFDKFDSNNKTVLNALNINQDLTKHLSTLQTQLCDKIKNIQQIPDIAKIKRLHQSIHNIEQLS